VVRRPFGRSLQNEVLMVERTSEEGNERKESTRKGRRKIKK